MAAAGQVPPKTKALTFLFHPLGLPEPKAPLPADNSLSIRIGVTADEAGLDVSYQAGKQLGEDKLILLEDIRQASPTRLTAIAGVAGLWPMTA
jgi:hypothetical protein